MGNPVSPTGCFGENARWNFLALRREDWGNGMVIRPMPAAYTMGEIGRPANKPGGNGGPASFFSKSMDVVSLGNASTSAGLYSGSPIFKIIGAVELMSEDFDFDDDIAAFGEHPVLL